MSWRGEDSTLKQRFWISCFQMFYFQLRVYDYHKQALKGYHRLLFSGKCFSRKRPIASLTLLGSSVKAQCDVFNFSTVKLGIIWPIDLLILSGGKARSLRAWMKSNGTSILGVEAYSFSSLKLISASLYQFKGPWMPWRENSVV